MKIKKQRSEIVFNAIGYVVIIVVGALCILPVLFALSGSFSSEASIYRHGYSIIPKEFSLEAYRVIFKAPEKILESFGVSVLLTAVGTCVGLFFTAMTAYVLYRKDFRHRNKFAFYIYFTTLFSGGMVTSYILMVRYLQLKNTFFAMLFPPLLSAMYILIMRNFMSSIPGALIESAKIDGAGDFRIFIRIALPLMGPALASIGMFIALSYWNNWYNAMLYIDRPNLYPLQYLLYRMSSNMSFTAQVTASSGIPLPDMPKQTIRMAMTIVTIAPVMLVYPFVQKFFVKGVTIGSVKG